MQIDKYVGRQIVSETDLDILDRHIVKIDRILNILIFRQIDQKLYEFTVRQFIFKQGQKRPQMQSRRGDILYLTCTKTT